MKLIFLLFIFTLNSWGACSTISRTNNSANTVLTSTKYNTDLNTAYTAINAIDGGCVTAGTLELAALDTSEFSVLLKGLTQGCKVIYSNASTIQIDKCLASVNGAFVNTTVATNASFGCSGCSSEVASSSYYVYIKTGSSGTTLNPLISSTAPNNDGYNNSGDKVVGRFYNNGSSDIDQYSIDQWVTNRFIPQETGWVDSGAISIRATSTPTKDSPQVDKFFWKRTGASLNIKVQYRQTSTGGSDGSGNYILNLPNSFEIDTTKTGVSDDADYPQACGSATWAITSATTSERPGIMNVYDSEAVSIVYWDSIADARLWGSGNGGTTAIFVNGSCVVPIKGWGE